jgi:hypothetical protein
MLSSELRGCAILLLGVFICNDVTCSIEQDSSGSSVVVVVVVHFGLVLSNCERSVLVVFVFQPPYPTIPAQREQ